MLLPFLHSAFPFALFLCISGIGDGFSNVSQRNVIQQLVKTDALEQVFSIRVLFRDISKSLISFFFGLTAEMFGFKISVISLGFFMCLIMLSVTTFFRTSGRKKGVFQA